MWRGGTKVCSLSEIGGEGRVANEGCSVGKVDGKRDMGSGGWRRRNVMRR